MRVCVFLCLDCWANLSAPRARLCVEYVMFGQVSMLNKWHALGSLIPNSDGFRPEAGFVFKASTHVRICAISEVGGGNGAERSPPPGIQAQRPSPSHRTHRTHDTTDQWRDGFLWLGRK